MTNCNPPGSSPSDGDYFDQVVLFATSETGFSNNLQTIYLGGSSNRNNSITFNNITDGGSKSLVIGNWSSDNVNDGSTDANVDDNDQVNGSDKYRSTDIDVSYSQDYQDLVIRNYGTVTIDACTYFDSFTIMPFVCASGTALVYLRNVGIITNGISKKTLFDNATCLQDGGAVYVCHGDVLDDPEINPQGWCDNDRDGYTNATGECDDEDFSINPAATEIPGDGIDQDCDGSD